MNDDLLRLVERFPPEQLQLLVDWKISDSIGRLVDSKDKPATKRYAECAIATHGSNILSLDQARRGLFTLLSEEDLADGVKELCGKTPHPNALANNLELVNLKWTSGSKIVDFVAEKFKLPNSLLPRKKRELRATEEIELFSVLPSLYPHQKEVVSQFIFTLKVELYKQLPSSIVASES